MSKITLSPNASGTGTFTIASPDSNSDRTLTLPDADGTVQVSGNPISGTTASFSGDVTLGSSVLATPTGSAPSYTCRAWVNFNGTGTVAIRASGNVTSITDIGVGTYTVNFTTAMPDVNYAVVATCGLNSAAGGFGLVGNNSGSTASTSTYQVRTITNVSAVADNAYVYVAIFR